MQSHFEVMTARLPPGLSSRNVEHYRYADVLRWTGSAGAEQSDPWDPASLLPIDALVTDDRIDYLVDASQPSSPPYRFQQIQDAVDQALLDAESPAREKGNPTRVISIRPGFYLGPVFIPKESPPLTLLGCDKSDVVLAARIDAQMPGQEYHDRFASRFAESHRATRAIFQRICARELITTGNSAVLRVESNDVRISNLSIFNLYACDRKSAAPEHERPDAEGRYAHGQHQAVAVHIAGADRTHLDRLFLSSFQDTLYLQSPRPFSTARTYVSACEIEGDVDFIFGQATAYFQDCEIRTRGLRGAVSWVCAPSTHIRSRHGFVFAQCRFTHDGAEAGRSGGSFLGRQWFEGVRATPYGTPDIDNYHCKPGDSSLLNGSLGSISRQTLEAVGKCVVMDSQIGPHINATAPWCDWNGCVPKADGSVEPVNWNPRYRPVQFTGADFLRSLATWIDANGLDYSDIDPEDIWVAVANG